MYTVEIDSMWSENNYFSGNAHGCDIGIEFVPGANDSFVDNTIEDFTVSARNTGAILRGILGGVTFSGFTFFPRADGATGVRLDNWNVHGCQFEAPRFDNPKGYTDTTAFEATSEYAAPGPTVYDPRAPTLDAIYDPGTGDEPLYALRSVAREYHIDNLHPAGGSLVVGERGELSLYDSDATEVFRVDSNGDITTGGDYLRGEPPVFNDGLKLRPADLRQRAPEYGEVSFHDGSGSYSLSLCFDAGSNTWYNVADGTEMTGSGT